MKVLYEKESLRLLGAQIKKLPCLCAGQLKNS